MAEEYKTLDIIFLFEEYRNIAATHDKLRDLLARTLNYFLLLSAFPFTVAGIMFRQGEFELLSPPGSLPFLFLIVGVGQLFLMLSFVDARLGQYRYARTVNLIRKYFADKVPALTEYLYLPTDPNRPSWEKLGHVGYQVLFMYFVGAIFSAYGMMGIATWVAGRWAGAIIAFATFGAYLWICQSLRQRILKEFQEHRGIR